MKVVIKDFSVEMEIKNKGVDLQINGNNGEFKGQLSITRTGLIGCKGKTKRKTGVPVNWDQSIEWVEGE